MLLILECKVGGTSPPPLANTEVAMLPSHLQREIVLDGGTTNAHYRHTPAIDEFYFRKNPVPENQIECVRCTAGRKLSSELRPRHERDLRLVLGHLATLDVASDELDRRRRRREKVLRASSVVQSSGRAGEKATSESEAKDFAQEQTPRFHEDESRGCHCSQADLSHSQQPEEDREYSDDSDTSDEEEEVVDDEDDFEHRLQPIPSHDPTLQPDDAPYWPIETSLQCRGTSWQWKSSSTRNEESADGQWTS